MSVADLDTAKNASPKCHLQGLKAAPGKDDYDAAAACMEYAVMDSNGVMSGYKPYGNLRKEVAKFMQRHWVPKVSSLLLLW